jgi:hypothetical protein
MELVWYLDRAAALVAYPSLYLAVVTGIVYNTPEFGFLRRAATKVHVELSVFAVLVTLLHAVLGVADAWFVVSGSVPAPTYSTGYFLGGVAIGVGALVVTLVAVVGFLDPPRFDRPWGPRVVHALAYAGFALGTLHAVAIGTDVTGLIRPLFVPALAFVGYLLGLRLLVERGVVTVPGDAASE